MKLLIAFLIEKIGELFAKIVSFFSRKAAVAALIIAMTTMVVTFTSAINGVLGGISSSSVANGYILFGLGLLPSNTAACISAIGVAKAAQWLFIWQMALARSAFDGK